MSVLFADSCTKIDAEHRERVPAVVAILVGAQFHGHHIFLQQGREDGAGNALVFHQKLEYGIVNRVGNLHNLNLLTLIL